MHKLLEIDPTYPAECINRHKPPYNLDFDLVNSNYDYAIRNV